MYGKELQNIDFEYETMFRECLSLLYEINGKFPIKDGFSQPKCIGVYFDGYLFEVKGKESVHEIKTDRSFQVIQIDNYQTIQDQSDNYERHLDGK